MRYTYTLVKGLLIVLSMIGQTVRGQSLEEENEKEYSRMDQSGFKDKIVLNRAIIIEEYLKPFEEAYQDKDGSLHTNLRSEVFNELVNIAERGNANNEKKPAQLQKLQNRSKAELEKTNIIPIGILNFDAILLSNEQIKENIEANESGKTAKITDYKSYKITVAGLFTDEVFQGDVRFQIGPELLYGNKGIVKMELHFMDGKGWKTFDLSKEQFVDHQFSASGNHGIDVKLITEKGEVYVTTMSLTVHSLTRRIPDSVVNFEIDELKTGRVNANVVGGNYAVYLGCDGGLNKPIIIAEGFDPGGVHNNFSTSDLANKYLPNMDLYARNGYDFVFVDYNSGYASISENAQVLKRVINDIKNQIAPTDSNPLCG